MKKLFASILIAAALVTAANAQPAKKAEPVYERTYIATDKDAYVAGDRIWCSAFCFRADSLGMSKKSAVAYVEILSFNGDIMKTAKIFLDGGRGAGYVDLPESMPTGNYRMLAFTAVNKNEKGYDFLRNSKVISVFNAKSPSKIRDKVEAVSDKLYADGKAALASDPEKGDLKLSIPGTARKGGRIAIGLENGEKENVSLSVSVYHNDAIAPAEDKSITSFEVGRGSLGAYTPEFLTETEGEIIYAKLAGKDRDAILRDEPAPTAYISTASSIGDTYTGLIGKNGDIVFMTNNIYGDIEVVTEVGDLENEELVGLVDIQSPFVNVESDVPVLRIAECIAKDVVARGRQMQTFRMEYADSLGDFRPRREEFPYTAESALVYNLDDYTRFPTIREVLVEITQEVRVRGRNNKQKIQVLTKDLEGDGGLSMSWETSLVLLDGVPVFKHKDMMDYDAMLLKEIDIWREKFIIGNRTFFGVVNFVSKKGNMAFMDFGSNVRIIDYDGVCYPMEFTGRYGNGEDTRQTILWRPEVEIAPGESASLNCQIPDYPGTFDIVVEGVTEDGSTIHRRTRITVED